ncbi:MAG: RHS repeat protein, partial [Saprospiraceae bacterium]|nr:RHS repeat protein [Saprospiraceae bacterium]
MKDELCSKNDQTIEWTNDLITKHYWGTWMKKYEWYSESRLLKIVQDIDGQQSNFTYDGLLRLKEASTRSGQMKTTYDYEYALLASGNTPNYIKTTQKYTGLEPRITFNHIDGLGRGLQTISMEYSPQREDVGMGAVEFDIAGRVGKEFFPFVSNETSGLFSNPTSAATSFAFEDSPLGRVETQFNPDLTHVRIAYGANTNQDQVINYHTLFPISYAPGVLSKQTTWDENNHVVVRFIDKLGREIVTRAFIDCDEDGNNCLNRLDTYTVYNDDGTVDRIISPEGAIYQYAYDNRDRLESKSIPGGGTTTIGYNDCNEITTTVDANGNSFAYTYDSHSQQLTMSEGGTELMVNTYEYDRLKTQGVKVLEPDGTYSTSSLAFSNSYDNFGRIYQKEIPFLTDGGASYIDRITTQYNSADEVLQSRRDHNGGHAIQIYDYFEYDHQGRLIDNWHQLKKGTNFKPKYLLSKSVYNFRDELVGKNLHSTNGGSSFLQQIGYGYTVRGWLTNINGISPPTLDDSQKYLCTGEPPLVFNEEENTEVIDIEDFISLVINGNTPAIEGTPCTPEEPPTGQECELSCNKVEVDQQQASRDSLKVDMEALVLDSLVNATFPNRLNLVEYCDGTTQYLLDEELSQIEGPFLLRQVIEIEGYAETLFSVIQNGQLIGMSLEEILARRIEEELLITDRHCPGYANTIT